MRTILLLLLLSPLLSNAQGIFDRYRAIPPEQIDPFQVFIFHRITGFYKTVGGNDACVLLVEVKGTGELVRIAGDWRFCRDWPVGTEMNFQRQEARNDSIQ